MWRTLSLIVPVLIPSWRFFKAIQPSPRVQWALVQGAASADWQEFRPRPAYVSPGRMLRRLLWNPRWNDTLFVVSCAERIAEAPTPHSVAEIQRRVQAEASRVRPPQPGQSLRFRLVFVHRDAGDLAEEVLFVSEPFAAGEAARC